MGLMINYVTKIKSNAIENMFYIAKLSKPLVLENIQVLYQLFLVSVKHKL